MKYIIALKTVIIFTMILIVTNTTIQAQQGLSFSFRYDILPYQDFDEQIIDEDSNTIDNAQTKLSKFKTDFSLPIVFSEGRTILVNQFSYQLIEFKYKELTNNMKRLHAGSYTLMLQHRLSEKWSMWAIASPGLASDLKADISEKDFNFQAALISIRHFSERFSLGFGAAYSTQFGSAVPLPLIGFDWNNGKNLMAKGIIPVSLEFWYRSSPSIDLGLVISGDGNNFHGDPAIYQVTNPELRYTILTFGPAAKLRISKNVVLNMETGIIGLHRFEFYDGDDEVNSYDLKPSQYARIGFIFGE